MLCWAWAAITKELYWKSLRIILLHRILTEVELDDDSSSDTEDDSFDALLEGTLPSNTSTIIKNLTSLLKIIHNTANKTNN